ncbi:hypothetical protein OS493_039581 [Desmophyllum pertusum]|uniref:Uncharacterized protein n=1 Tax=Desmophyllum pertusum TaxID=174260 RepID=A0A9W9Y848_9CNID|nr:hypothetical protein OS493_039581 [Desmophyllum pertusum]
MKKKLPVIVEQGHCRKALFNGGLLIVWGCGEFGQHGHGHSEDVPIGDALGCPPCGWMIIRSTAGGTVTVAHLGVGTTETSPHPRPLHLGVSSGTKAERHHLRDKTQPCMDTRWRLLQFWE